MLRRAWGPQILDQSLIAMDIRVQRDNSRDFRGQRAITINFASKLVSMLFGFGFQVSVVKILVPSQFAVYALALAAIVIGQQLLSFGVGETLIRFVPWGIASGDVYGLKLLARRMIALRAISLFVILAVLMFCLRYAPAFLPIGFAPATLGTCAVWLVSWVLFTNIFDLAQSLMLQREVAIVTISEAAIRLMALYVLYLLGQPVDAPSVIGISALTCVFAVMLLGYLVWRNINLPWGSAQKPSMGNPLSFALGRYMSSTTALVASPSAVRLVAASGLDVLPLAAFSFVQNLYASVQKALPGLILLQSMEPILLTRLAEGVRYEKILSSIAVIFKLELFFALTIFIASFLAGPTIITLLARPEYAPYWYILLVLGVTQAINAAYRVLEVISSAVAKQAIFFWIWPIGVLSTACIYFTAPTWGIWAALFFPLLEGVLRLGSVMLFFRKDGVQIALDVRRSLIMTVSAGIVVVTASLLRPDAATAIGNLLVAAGGIVVFTLLVCFARPLRPLEHQLILKMIPKNWKAIRMLADAITVP
jgi:O-antigen/teichoic acid export membrane protein